MGRNVKETEELNFFRILPGLIKNLIKENQQNINLKPLTPQQIK